MKRYNPFHQFFSIIALCSVLFFVAGCNDQPAPGPMSPIKSADQSTSTKSSSTQSTEDIVRPVTRLDNSGSNALAKSGYNEARVLQRLREVRDELEAIVDNNRYSAVAYKFDDAVDETNSAITKLVTSSSSFGDVYVLYKLANARGRVQDAINSGMLASKHGEQFINQYKSIESQIQAGASPTNDYRGSGKSLWVKRTYGGLITFCGHRIKVPKYATKQDAEFSINIASNDYITVDFGPDGWFDQEVTVTISYAEADLTGIDVTKLTLAWYDESIGKWINLGGTVDLINKTVTAKTKHFTQYTISTK